MNGAEIHEEVVGSGRVRDPHAQEWERTYAMWTHLAGLFGGIAAAASAGISLPLSLVIVLILWLVKRDQSPFIDDHGKEAVNFQISLLLYAIVLVPIAGVITCGLGFLLIIPVALLAIIGGILAATAANRGEYYRYPATIRLVH